MIVRTGFAVLMGAVLVTGAPAALWAQNSGGTTKKPTSKNTPSKNETKGQGQLSGANGQFGTVYTLQNNFNFEIVSARYTLHPYVAYTAVIAEPTTKIVVLDLAIKNVAQADNFFNPEGLFTLVDEKGQLYPGGSLRLQSQLDNEAGFNLRPGQGLGQAALKDPLQIGFSVPNKARIVKIMVNQGRQGKSEEVLRYYVAGATKEEAGEAGDPKNTIAPLPENTRDAADKSGAVVLDEAKGKSGEYVPSGYFAIRLDSFAYSTDMLNGNPPDEGKKFAIATVTAKNLMPKELGMFDVEGGDNPQYEITDSDGERSKPTFYRKAKRDEDPEHTFKKDDEYTFRIVFTIPKDATVKKLVMGTGEGHKWAYDVSGMK